MPGLISTEIAILLSLLAKKMPNLFKYITQYSAIKHHKHQATTTTKALSPHQIQEACQHPSTIILHTLSTITTVQEALNITKSTITNITTQRNNIENALASLATDANNQQE